MAMVCEDIGINYIKAFALPGTKAPMILAITSTTVTFFFVLQLWI